MVKVWEASIRYTYLPQYLNEAPCGEGKTIQHAPPPPASARAQSPGENP
jgi:hypothetical protein